MTTLKVKELTFEKLFPNAEIVLYDTDLKTLEVDGKQVNLDGIDLDNEFIQMKAKLEKVKSNQNSKG